MSHGRGGNTRSFIIGRGRTHQSTNLCWHKGVGVSGVQGSDEFLNAMGQGRLAGPCAGGRGTYRLLESPDTPPEGRDEFIEHVTTAPGIEIPGATPVLGVPAGASWPFAPAFSMRRRHLVVLARSAVGGASEQL